MSAKRSLSTVSTIISTYQLLPHSPTLSVVVLPLLPLRIPFASGSSTIVILLLLPSISNNAPSFSPRRLNAGEATAAAAAEVEEAYMCTWRRAEAMKMILFAS